MKRIFPLFLGLFLLIAAPLSANAQIRSNTFEQFFNSTFSESYNTEPQNLENTLPQAVGSVITVMLSIIGVILLVLVVWAGFLWLTAGGNADQVQKAQAYIKNGVIGLIIALSAFVITQFVVSRVQQAVNTGGGGGVPTNTNNGGQTGSGGSGNSGNNNNFGCPSGTLPVSDPNTGQLFCEPQGTGNLPEPSIPGMQEEVNNN